MLHSSPFPRLKSLCFRSGFSLLPAFACTALLFSPLLRAFACTALLDSTSFAVPKTEKPLLSLRLFSLAGLRLHGSTFFAVASGVRPPRLCSTVHPSPFPRPKSLCFRSGFSLLPAFALHGSARCYTLRRSHPEKTSFFRDAGVRPIKRSVICLSKASFLRH